MFLYPVVRHLAIDEGRKSRRQGTAHDDQMDVACGPDVEPDAREELAAVMVRLSEEHREVVLMRFVDGFSVQKRKRCRIPFS